MTTQQLKVNRLPVWLTADPARVIARRFIPGGEGRVEGIIERVFALPDSEVDRVLDRVLRDYSTRHKDLEEVFRSHFDYVKEHMNGAPEPSENRRLLLGAFFTLEYTLESVALFNPSMVPHPDQDGVEPGSLRFIVSLRACGEGHISSIEFRSGLINADGELSLDPVSRYAARQLPTQGQRFDKNAFYLKLIEVGSYNRLANRVLKRLDDEFTIADLTKVLDDLHWTHTYVESFHELAESMLWLARSNYKLKFPSDSSISERVIFPVTENESRGIEDARFVRFARDDGSPVYYATYTAYNGIRTLPQLIETEDFRHFKINTLNGTCVQNKGMALFPRRIGGSYVMLARLDGENIYLLRSDNIQFWNESQKLHGPTSPWEFVQVGNCGSPIETPHGWLVLTHGVGPMREYWMGALLLDLEDPSRVTGYLAEPMLTPAEDERDGYVPNVVYSCGAIEHNGQLVMPYAVADTSTRFATIALDDILSRMTPR